MSLQALIYKAPYLDPHGVSERFIVQDDEFETRVHQRTDGTTIIDVCLIVGEERELAKRRVYPFFMYRLDKAKILARYLLVEYLVHTNASATDDEKRMATKASNSYFQNAFPYQQGTLL